MEFIFPVVIFLFVVITSLMKNMRTRGSNDQDSTQGPKWKRMYDTWEDVVGRIEKELNPQSHPRPVNETSIEDSEVMTSQATDLTDSYSYSVKTIPMSEEDTHSGMYIKPAKPVNETSHEVGLTRKEVINGIIMSEVLGKPRAMKPYRYGKYRS